MMIAIGTLLVSPRYAISEADDKIIPKITDIDKMIIDSQMNSN